MSGPEGVCTVLRGVCTSRGVCVQVVGGVYKSYRVCTSRRFCLQVVGGVYKS